MLSILYIIFSIVQRIIDWNHAPDAFMLFCDSEWNMSWLFLILRGHCRSHWQASHVSGLERSQTGAAAPAVSVGAMVALAMVVAGRDRR
jgi:hypothetical protein